MSRWMCLDTLICVQLQCKKTKLISVVRLKSKPQGLQDCKRRARGVQEACKKMKEGGRGGVGDEDEDEVFFYKKKMHLPSPTRSERAGGK